MQANGRGPLALFQLALAPAPAPAILPLYGQTCMTALARVLACKPYVVYGMVWYGMVYGGSPLMSGSSQSARQGHFACMYRLFCLISILYEYICINQSEKKNKKNNNNRKYSLTCLLLRASCNFYLFKSNWQRTTAAHIGDTVAHIQIHLPLTHATDSTQ